MEYRDYLIALAIKYQGSYWRIKKAVRENEEVEKGASQQAITIVDEDYPAELMQLRYPPLVLFYRGDRRLLKGRKIAVVGSREAVKYGIQATNAIVRELNRDFTIVSGMARGIDRIAHLSAARSIGVLGNGLDIIYPTENRDLYCYMEQKQLLISEYPCGVRPQRYHFPFRNRIIAALGEKLIVTQAREKSGTMLTVEETLELGKEVYAVPYRLLDVEGAGCNYLLQQGALMIDLKNVREYANG